MSGVSSVLDCVLFSHSSPLYCIMSRLYGSQELKNKKYDSIRIGVRMSVHCALWLCGGADRSLVSTGPRVHAETPRGSIKNYTLHSTVQTKGYEIDSGHSAIPNFVTASRRPASELAFELYYVTYLLPHARLQNAHPA